jgi:argininosuccinate lyase
VYFKSSERELRLSLLLHDPSQARNNGWDGFGSTAIADVEELRKIDERIEDDVVKYLSLEASMNARISKGGTATSATLLQIKDMEEWLKEFK